MKRMPPRLARWLVKRLSKYEVRYSLDGDLKEAYDSIYQKEGQSRANSWYWTQTVKALRSYSVLNLRSHIMMIANYLKIALRNIRRYKGYSLINIAGLALGIACCLLISAFVLHELSYDKFHENARNVYRLDSIIRISGRFERTATVPPLMGPTMIQDFPEVVDAVRFRDLGGDTFRTEGKCFHESGLLYVDNSIFNIFSFDLVRGDPRSALLAPRTVVLTEETARNYFGDEDPIGKIIERDNWEDFTVTGIVKKPPVNSHFSFDLLASMETLVHNSPERMNRWAGWNFQTYVLLQEGADPVELESKLVDFNLRYVREVLETLGAEVSNTLRPLTRIHLHSHLNGELGSNGDIVYIYAFSAIAFFILFIACINFMNLSTARAARRVKEIGIRKVLGAVRAQLSRQFLGESVVFSSIATTLALTLSAAAMPLLRELSGREIAIHTHHFPMIAGALVLVALFVGIVSGLYPSIVLSRYRPTRVLKGGFEHSSGQSIFRNTLVVVQFAISIFLIAGTGIVYEQMMYMKSRDLGFERERVAAMPLRDGYTRKRVRTLKQEISALAGVLSTASSSSIPGRDTYWNDAFYPEDWRSDQPFFMKMLEVGEDYFDTYGIPVISGRTFSEEIVTDAEQGLILNETAVEQLEWDEPLGKRIGQIADVTDLSRRQFRAVVGVIGDYHYLSMHAPIEPLYIAFGTRFANFVSVRLQAGNLSKGLRDVERVWKRILPDREFEYFFVDEYFDRQYRSEERLTKLFQLFTLLAIFIGSIGLLGLVSFAAEQRTKEIGIRKVLGSSSQAVVALLCRQFVWLVITANVVAWPVAYFVMGNWLRQFAYQTKIGIDVFVLSGSAALGIALITVSYRAVRAAAANPVDALRYE